MSCIQLSLTNSTSPRWEEKGNNNAVVRTYTWGLDISESSHQGAGGVAIEIEKRIENRIITGLLEFLGNTATILIYDDSKFLIEKKRKELEIRLYREYFIPFVRNINLNKYQYKSAC